MQFNLYHWLFDDPYTAGTGAGLSGPEPFRLLWPWLICSCVGLLIAFYYAVEGRKRFFKDKPLEKYMLDRYLGWFAVICFIALPLIFARVQLYQYFFAWRFWRILLLLGLLAWGIHWLVYLVRKYPAERANSKAWDNRQKYIRTSSKRSGKRKAKAGAR
ncbi:MAG: hypothetical protein J2P37_24925 [Ktedonobacteraceae bacterium]|nr:hypothetical protein [Ktedonobacteraceae bacterium]